MIEFVLFLLVSAYFGKSVIKWVVLPIVGLYGLVLLATLTEPYGIGAVELAFGALVAVYLVGVASALIPD